MKFYSVYIRKYEKVQGGKGVKQNRWIFSIAVLLFFLFPSLLMVKRILTLQAVRVLNSGKQDKSDGWMPQPNGGYAQNEWKQVGGEWYHFDDRGYMQTGWINDNGARYYLNEKRRHG